MTLDEFVKEFHSKAIDFDRISGVQCVDTIKMYFYYVLGIEPQIIGNANEYADRYYELPYLYENFYFIPYAYPFTPQRGDVVVWNKGIGEYGHIAIASGKSTPNMFQCYEQNGSIPEMQTTDYNYDNVEAILRPREEYYEKIGGIQ